MSHDRGDRVEGIEAGDGAAGDWLALQFAGALRPRDCTARLRADGDPKRALATLGRAPTRARVERARQIYARMGARLLPFATSCYPRRLVGLEDAPPVIAVRGDATALSAPAVGIVGSRAASAYGRAAAHRLAAELAEAGVVVVSGLAYGIDAAAHRGALEAGGRTVAVQACGLDRVYPARHRALAAEIVASGAIVSEFPIGMEPRKGFFPLRNRLITGLSAALVVVEARERSGSLTSARHAAEQGVEVLAVPGPIGVPGHRGSNGLLREGAAPLLETRDVLDVLAWPSTDGATSAATLSPPAEVLLAALRGGAEDTDALARRMKTSPAELAPALLELELQGLCVRERDGRWRALG